MSSTIRSGTLYTPRSVTYTAAGGSAITLDYCNYTVSSREIMVGRHAIKTIYRFSFSFVLSGSSSSELSDIITNAQRTLRQKGGTIVINEGGVDIYRIAPASGVVVANPGTIDRSVRPTIFSDIEWGPTPVSVSIQPIGVGGYGQWVVDVTVPAEDPLTIGDLFVLGVDAEVSYSLDKNHYTTRNVTGRIHVAHINRPGASTPVDRNVISQADQEAVRLALLAGTGAFTNKFMKPVRIPPNFERTNQTLSVDNTENILNFNITDRECYRLYPPYVTDADLTVNVNIGGNSLAQYVCHTLQGFCESPRDVQKGRVLQACIEQIDDAIGAVLTRKVGDNIAFVSSVSFTNHVYRNRIDYQLVVYSPFGNFDFFNSLGITNYRSAVFFPQMTGGSAQLYGSGYRLEDTKERTSAITENKTESDKGTAPKSALDEAKKEQEKLPRGAICVELKAGTSISTGTRHAVPNTKNSLSESYQVNEEDYQFCIYVWLTYIKEDNKTGFSYLNDFLNMLKGISGLQVVRHMLGSQTKVPSKIGGTSAFQESFWVSIIVTGDLRKKIIAAGGMEAFVTALNETFTTTENDSIISAIGKFMSGGQSQ